MAQQVLERSADRAASGLPGAHFRRWFPAAAVLLCSLFHTGCRSQPPFARLEPRLPAVPAAGAQEGGPAQERLFQQQLSAAWEDFRSRRYEAALVIVRDLQNRDDSLYYPQALFLQARIALAQDDSVLATFYLKKILENPDYTSSFDPSTLSEIYDLLASLAYDTLDFDQAYRYYLETVNLAPEDSLIPRQTWIRLSEIAFYHYGDREAARFHLSRSGQGSGESTLLERLTRRLRWSSLSAEQLGLSDNNISAVQMDGDDLWVGSWNGGISRYSLAGAAATVFKEGRDTLTARTVRTIEITPAKVWIGTYQGLYQYTKATSRWQEVPFFGGNNPKKVEALEVVHDTLYLGTLGHGLWRLDGQAWRKVSQGGLPGDFINCLLEAKDYLLIGTLNLGLIVLDLGSGRMFSFDSLNPALNARNIIMLLSEGNDLLWIGTYGEGLYRWQRSSNELTHYSKAKGQLGDDWVLCGVATSGGLYFGTFGGGVTHLSYGSSNWERIGLRQGLSALDISAADYQPPFLYFGTLGSGVSILDESLVVGSASGIQ